MEQENLLLRPVAADVERAAGAFRELLELAPAGGPALGRKAGEIGVEIPVEPRIAAPVALADERPQPRMVGGQRAERGGGKGADQIAVLAFSQRGQRGDAALQRLSER